DRIQELLARAEPRLLGEYGHLLEARTFGEGHADEFDDFAPGGELIEDRERRAVLLKQEVPRAELALDAHQAGQQLELAPGADDPQFFELFADVARVHAFLQAEGDFLTVFGEFRTHDALAENAVRRAGNEVAGDENGDD